HMRRLATSTGYEFLNPLAPWNEFITLSAFALGMSQLLFMYNFIYSVFAGKPAETNPWEASTLEWTIPNPVPVQNFVVLPVVTRGPHEYSSPDTLPGDWLPQNAPANPSAPAGH
ncbi:MAG TPA: cytochrome c oxidase subunit I, partial [bacterium]|nr:cytochrome c oxidase subunit I [bacterium]